METLGECLSEMLNKITKLILETRDGDRKELERQQEEIAKSLRILIDENVKQDTIGYKALTEEIKKANVEIKASLDDIKNVAKTIKTIGTVLGRLSQVAATISP